MWRPGPTWPTSPAAWSASRLACPWSLRSAGGGPRGRAHRRTEEGRRAARATGERGTLGRGRRGRLGAVPSALRTCGG
eukprot:614332-Alexandrium_andersonii.AAC.1